MALKTGILVSALLAMATPALAAGPWVQTGWWKFNDWGAIAFRDSKAGNTGTTYGPAYAHDCNRGTHCLYFDGVNDFAAIPYSVGNQPGTNNFRVVATIWPTLPRPAQGADILVSSGDPNPYWKMAISEPGATGQLSCGFRGTLGQSYVFGGPDLYDNLGHTVECRLIRKLGTDQTQGLVDGVPVFSLFTPVGAVQTNQNIILGASCCLDTGYFAGWMDDVKLFTSTP